MRHVGRLPRVCPRSLSRRSCAARSMLWERLSAKPITMKSSAKFSAPSVLVNKPHPVSFYQQVLRPMLFLADAEAIHHLAMDALAVGGPVLQKFSPAPDP